MTANQLHKITTALRAQKQGNIDVAINFASFSEDENGNILIVESAKLERVQCSDDSGPVDYPVVNKKFPFLVLSGRAT